MKIENHVYYVFGGASGLGEATVRRLHEKGAYVAIFDRNNELGDTVAKSLNSQIEAQKVSTGAGSTQRAISIQVDITNEDDIQKAILETDSKFKNIPIGGTVIASGIGMVGQTIDREGTPHDMGIWSTILDVNLSGTFNAARLVAARLVRDVPKPIAKPDPDTECRGVIITVASQAGLEGQAGQVAYATSKAGVVGMTLPMARDLSWYSIRVCTVCPSIFETPLSVGMPERARARTLKSAEFPARFGKPEEFAHATQMLIENDMLNGLALRLDGATRLAKL
ncbi:unnamed protein product [Sympodiomycopsis kandeliae]